MKKPKELRQALNALKKVEQEYNTGQLSEKMLCLPELILKNNALSGMILPLPNDECKIIFKELIGSDEFTAMIEKINQNSIPLKELREKKRVKAELRKKKASAS